MFSLTPDRTTKSRQLPTFQKVGSRVPRLAFPPLNTIAVYSRLFNGGNKQTSISTACFQPLSNPDRTTKSRQLPTFPKVGSRVPRLAFPPLNTVAVYSRLFNGGNKQTSISTACFQPSSNPDRPTKSRQLPTFSKVGICRAPWAPPLSASSASRVSICRFR